MLHRVEALALVSIVPATALGRRQVECARLYGLEESIAALCRREGIAEGLNYSWSKEFLEAGKKRLSGDTQRQATSSEVRDLRREMQSLKELVAELSLENRLLKKSTLGGGDDDA